MSKQRERFLIISIAALVVVTAAFLAYLIYNRSVRRNYAPVITCTPDTISVSVNAQDRELLRGVTASDTEDGDLTSSVIIESISQFVEKGKCTITYAVFDSGNRVATASRTLYYTDYHSPRFELTSDLIYQSGTAVEPLSSVRAYDCFEGDITNRISMTIVGSNDFGSSDTREVEFRVINSFGDVASFRANIVVVEHGSPSVPVIRLSNYLTYIHAGDTLDPLSFAEEVRVMQEVLSPDDPSLTLYADTEGFDPSVPGTYRIPIYCESRSQTGSTVLYVIVEG